MRKAEILELLNEEAEVRGGDPFAGDIEQAESWDDLSTFCKEIVEAYRQGQLGFDEVETLTVQIAEKAHELPETVPQQSLRALLLEKPIRRVRSAALGEDTLWAADNAGFQKTNTLVVYRERELKEIVGRSAEKLRALHRCKCVLDMELVAPGEEEGERIDAEALLEHAADYSCYACGNSKWWTKADGERICGICHPKPG